jgi:hypothetical protein
VAGVATARSDELSGGGTGGTEVAAGDGTCAGGVGDATTEGRSAPLMLGPPGAFG